VMPAKVDDRLMAELNVEKTRFVPVPAAQVGERPAGGQSSEDPSEDPPLPGRAEESTGSNVGQRRSELAKEAADSTEYEESFDNIQMAPDDKFVFAPTGQTDCLL